MWDACQESLFIEVQSWRRPETSSRGGDTGAAVSVSPARAGNHGDRAVMDSFLGTIARPCPASGSVGSPWCGLQRPTKSLTYAVGTPGQVPTPRSSERRLRAQRGSAGAHRAGSLRRQRTARLFWECLTRTSSARVRPRAALAADLVRKASNRPSRFATV